jgi:LacI family transcriptional regulator
MKLTEFTQKQISHQAGLSMATIDRVLHNRDGVRRVTIARVKQALRELRNQQEQMFVKGRQFMIDVVMEAPDRFTTLLREALEAEMQNFRPAIFRSRFHLNEVIEVPKIVKQLRAIGLRGSHGVLLKAPDHPAIVEAIERLSELKIPVITVATDVQHSKRLNYIGIDNRAAGETAAYLVASWMARKKDGVLVVLSSTGFRGEEEREMGFRKALRAASPNTNIVEVSGGFGRPLATEKLVLAALQKNKTLRAVYSIGGANAAILQAFATANRKIDVFIGHDLDEDNVGLLKQGKLNAVLHHNLNSDMQNCCRLIMQANGALPHQPLSALSAIQVITPFNIANS